MQVVTLKPRPGVRVLDPASRQPIPASGCSVLLDKYWRRRITAGDVEVVANVVRVPDETGPGVEEQETPRARGKRS